MAKSLVLAQNATADALLSTNPAALLTGMLLDQQFPMESAFAGPQKIAERMGGEFDIEAIAHADPDEFAALCSQTPAVHRYPGSMAKRIQALCAHLLEAYDGRAEGIWTDGDPDGKEVLRRLKALPGFGDQKARIFLALLGKQLGVALDGWRAAAGAYGEEGSRRSIADVTDAKSLMEVREFKQEQKRAAKTAK